MSTARLASDPATPEAALVALARKGDRAAFEELVRRRQPWIRNLMRRFSGNAATADELAQQVFLQAWRSVHLVRHTNRFGPWLKRLAVNTWLQYLRKNDPLRDADELVQPESPKQDAAGVAMDLDRALGALPDKVRFCIVLSYHEGMTHDEISAFTELPLGTVKSHIRRGSAQLRERLSAYSENQA